MTQKNLQDGSNCTMTLEIITRKVTRLMRRGARLPDIIDAARLASQDDLHRFDITAQRVVCNAMMDSFIRKYPSQNTEKLLRQIASTIELEDQLLSDDFATIFLESLKKISSLKKNWDVRQFSYSLKTDTEDNYNKVNIHSTSDILSGSTGNHPWSCGFLLGEIALNHRNIFQGKRILELGAGVGVSTICMARQSPAALYATDGNKKTLDNLMKNLSLNGLCIETMNNEEIIDLNKDTAAVGACKVNSVPNVKCGILDWGTANVNILKAIKPDIIIGSDLVYSPENITPLIDVLLILLEFSTTSKQKPMALLVHAVRNQDTFNAFRVACIDNNMILKDVTKKFLSNQQTSIQFHHDVKFDEESFKCYQITL